MSSMFVDAGMTRSRETTPQPHDAVDGRNVEVRCFDSFGDVEPLRDSWNDLVERTGGDVFATFEWCAAWWKHFRHRRRLQLFVAKSEGRLVAVWPLFRERLWWGPVPIRVVRILGCDHGVTTCKVTTETGYHQSVAQMVMSQLECSAAWDLMHLGELPGYLADGDELVSAFRASERVSKVAFDREAYPQAVFEVPGEFEDYLSRLSLKERRNVRRDQRQIALRGGVAHHPQTVEEVKSALSNLRKLHETHWRLRGRGGHFADVPGVGAFYADIAKAFLAKHWLALTEVKSGDDSLAVELALQFNGRMHWLIGGRCEDVSARVGFAALMQSAIQRQLTMIDALGGEYDYKRRLGASQQSIKLIAVFPQGRARAARLAVVRGIVRAVDFVYHRLWFWRVAPWIMKRMPHLGAWTCGHGVWEKFARSRFLVVGRRHNPVDLPAADEGE